MTEVVKRLQSVITVKEHFEYDLTNHASHKEIEWLRQYVANLSEEAQSLVQHHLSIQLELIKNPYYPDYFMALIEDVSPYELSKLSNILEDLKEFSAFSTTNIHEYPVKAVIFICNAMQSAYDIDDLTVFLFLQISKLTEKNSDEGYRIILSNLSYLKDNVSKEFILDPAAYPFLLSPYSKSVAADDLLFYYQLAQKNALIKEVLKRLHGIHNFNNQDNLSGAGYFMLRKDFAHKMLYPDFTAKKPLKDLLRLSFYMKNKDRFQSFFFYWSKSGYAIQELYRFIKLVRLNGITTATLDNYTTYLKALYQYDYPHAFILASALPSMKEIIFYAVAHHKKAFLRSLEVSSCMLELKPHLHWASLLLDTDNFIPNQNLNTLTAKDIIKACDMDWDTYKYLSGRKGYNLKELEVLSNKNKRLIRTTQDIYDALKIDNMDKRLLVIKQLKNYGLLTYIKDLADSKPTLIEKLSEMNLSQWIERRFSHISDITPKTALHLMLLYDSHKNFILQAQNENQGVFLWRNYSKGVFRIYNELSEILGFIEKVDTDFLELADQIPLKEDFIDNNRERVKAFCLNGSAYIANQYMQHLNERQKEGFGNLIKAELIGKFDLVKYSQADISKELELRITEDVFKKWTADKVEAVQGYSIMETGCFDYTLRCGMLPYPTCLAYDDDKHGSKFLANFDTNKKILLVWLNNKIVGRAILRLTKVTANAENYVKELKFADIEQQIPDSVSEDLVLFLERMYYIDINKQMQEQMQKALIEYVNAKARDMGMYAVISPKYDILVNSVDYTNKPLHIFISKTKADGEQYLDSVGGPASKKDEGTYYRGEDGFYLKNNEVPTEMVLA